MLIISTTLSLFPAQVACIISPSNFLTLSYNILLIYLLIYYFESLSLISAVHKYKGRWPLPLVHEKHRSYQTSS